MTAFDITTNAGPLGASLRHFPVLIERYLKPALTLSVLKINNKVHDNIRSNNSFSTTGLMTSILNDVAANGLEAIVYSNKNYAIFIEHGRGPGKGPESRDKHPILDWLRTGRGITPYDPNITQKQLAFLIARKIALHGIAPKPFMKPAYESEKAATINRVNEAIQQAIREIH